MHSTAVLKAAEIRTGSILCVWFVCMRVRLIPATGQIDTVKLDQLESYGSAFHVQQVEHFSNSD